MCVDLFLYNYRIKRNHIQTEESLMNSAMGGQWIWADVAPSENQYAVFKEEFFFDGGECVLKICAVSDYIAEINGNRASFGQYRSFDGEKYYDTVKIDEYCTEGKNEIKITVRYEGIDSAVSIKGKPMVIFAVSCGGEVVAASSENTLSALSTEYVQGAGQYITPQLGLASHMRRSGNEKYGKSVLVDTDCTLTPLPIKKCRLLPPVTGKLIDKEKRIYDLGAETVGYLHLKINCDEECAVTVAYGEHIDDGCVRSIIKNRNFSLKFYCEKGENDFTQLFVRLGARYIQLFSDGECEACVELLPYEYPTEQKSIALHDLDKKIYDTCVRTLKCCMHEHYEDCPWREQALYVLDSRNQMLCGYHAFEGTEFQRQCLLLMAKGVMENGLLELTFPAVNTPSIPFFSIMYQVAVSEYVKYTGDTSLSESVMDVMKNIMSFFAHRIDSTGLIPNLKRPFWNFYEWNDGSDGNSCDDGGKRYDLILNCAYIYAMRRFNDLCGGKSGIDFDEDKMKKAIDKTFYDEKEGAYFISTSRPDLFTDLGNAFAILIGLGTTSVYEKLKSGEMLPATLSMLCYVYDALLAVSEDNKEYVLSDIRKKYGYMLDNGATTFWETLDGSDAFDGAGSLCHGWSAMPIYYYHMLMKE